MKEQFIMKRIRGDKLRLIQLADEIITEYRDAGFTLTLRQLYYQFVARGLIPNTQRSYEKLGDAVNDGRMLGLLDWSAIEDRTRGMDVQLRMDSPRQGIEIVRAQYHIDMWENQPTRIEVWIEKEALIGVIEPICRELDLPYLACRGYVSQSEQWRAYHRFQKTHEAGQRTVILHLGDHDPSGIDMTRDNDHRLSLFLSTRQGLKYVGDQDCVEVRRIALNMDQIEKYNPPPNPAKLTDSRFESYAARFGDKSWELDALSPNVIDELIRTEVDDIRDFALWEEREMQLSEDKAALDHIIAGLT